MARPGAAPRWFLSGGVPERSAAPRRSRVDFGHTVGTLAMRLQAGSIHQYLLYMGLALVVLLWLGYHA